MDLEQTLEKIVELAREELEAHERQRSVGASDDRHEVISVENVRDRALRGGDATTELKFGVR